MNEKFFKTLTHHLALDEGICHGFYLCPANKLTCGIGHNVEANPIKNQELFTWLKKGMTEEEVNALLHADLLRQARLMSRYYAKEGWLDHLSFAQSLGWVNMAFQMGVPTQATFKRSIKHLRTGRYGLALYSELLDSDWAQQTPERAKRVAIMLAYKTIPPYYDEETPYIMKPTLISPGAF